MGLPAITGRRVRGAHHQRLCAGVLTLALGSMDFAAAQPISFPWSSHGHDAQHSGISKFASRPLNRILWQTPVDLAPQYNGTDLLIHYGAPLISRLNTVIIPVKTGVADGFRVEAHSAADGSLIWMQGS